MNYNDRISSTTSKLELNPLDRICRICGDVDALIHYGALSCVSCKIFFRRNSQFDINNNQCVFDGNCDVTVSSRRACRYCRLKKCLDIGMQRDLLRASHLQQRLHQNQRKNSLTINSTIQTLDLLQNDRSLLTTEQWSYLSNIIHLYDKTTPVLSVRNLLKNELSYPMKIRCKMMMNNMFTIMSTMYQAILPFIEQISQFKHLTLNDQTILIERNIKSAGGYGGIIICRDAEFCSSSTFQIGFSSVYGSILMDDAIKTNNRADNDSTLIKLLLPALIFSTGSDLYISMNENEEKYHLLSNIKSILEIQNFYIEILFKYMIFRYGYDKAALRFAELIKNSLDQIMCALRAADIQKHEQLVQTVIKQTEQSLILQNETNINLT